MGPLPAHLKMQEHKGACGNDPKPISLHGAAGPYFLRELYWIKVSAIFLPILAAGPTTVRFVPVLTILVDSTGAIPNILLPPLPLHLPWPQQIRGL